MDYRHESALRSGIGDLKEGKYSDALTKIAPHARSGNKLAQETMSLIHARGLGVPVDPIRARIWLRRAECRCDNPGKIELDTAHSFLVGMPPPKDPERALYWYEQAAEAGNRHAQRLLAESEQASKQGLIVPARVTDYWREFLKRPE
jgi:TPR repeat protein